MLETLTSIVTTRPLGTSPAAIRFAGVARGDHVGADSREARDVRGTVLLLSILVLAGCASTENASPGVISCQPYGYTTAPIAFSFTPGRVTSSMAEQTAVALVRACAQPFAITNLTSSSQAAAAMLAGPNAGQTVWLVQVEAPIAGGESQGYWLIEVNQTTGVPTLIGLG